MYFMGEQFNKSEQLNESMKQKFHKSQHMIKWSPGQRAIEQILLKSIL